MKEYRLSNIADSLFNCLRTIRSNIFNENELIKNFPPKSPIEAKNCFKNFPMPASHIKVILYLEKYKSSSISQIGDSLNISRSNMTPIIDKLISYDLVNRYNDQNDRRIIRVELTEKAYNIFNIFNEYAKDCISEKISKLSSEDIDLLESSLFNLNNIFHKLADN